jgi:hypothetical protein
VIPSPSLSPCRVTPLVLDYANFVMVDYSTPDPHSSASFESTYHRRPSERRPGLAIDFSRRSI